MNRLKRIYYSAGVSMTLGVLSSSSAYASSPTGFNVTRNIVASLENLPGLVTALAYLAGAFFGVIGILKIKDHVENPQTPLKDGAVKLGTAGAMFALPYVFEVMQNTISGGVSLGGPTLTTLNALTITGS